MRLSSSPNENVSSLPNVDIVRMAVLALVLQACGGAPIRVGGVDERPALLAQLGITHVGVQSDGSVADCAPYDFAIDRNAYENERNDLEARLLTALVQAECGVSADGLSKKVKGTLHGVPMKEADTDHMICLKAGPTLVTCD